MIEVELLNSLLDGFQTVEWPIGPGVLRNSPEWYVYVFILSLGSGQLPFYAGQTKRLAARMGDYESAQFAASTDFRVGEAIRFFAQERQCGIQVRFKQSDHGLQDEYLIIRELQLSGFHMLNSLLAYDYRQASKEAEREVIQRFCRMILRQAERG